MKHRLIRPLLLTAMVFSLSAVAATPALAGQLNGVFHIGSGSYIRMGLPGGGFFANPYSASANKTYTLISSGVDGGIRSGVAQRQPSPGFDGRGDSLANRIIQPTNFTGIRFGVVTTVPPTFTVSNGRITGHLRHLYAEWNKQTFRQGNMVSGTYNAATHHYTLSWHTIVHGGPFDGYTGYWHLQGTFAGS